MADIDRRIPDNAPGLFYVDDCCLICNACCETAPMCFKYNEKDRFSYVHRQPETRDEYLLCLEALHACCVEAIGIDPSVENPWKNLKPPDIGREGPGGCSCGPKK